MVKESASAMNKTGKAKKKWSKGKVKDKSNNTVILDKQTYDKLYKDVLSYRFISISIFVDRLKINGSLARKALKALYEEGIIKKVDTHHAQTIYKHFCETCLIVNIFFIRMASMQRFDNILSKLPLTRILFKPSKPIDRQKTTPFLLRIFFKIGGFHSIEEFQPESQPVADEVQIYTWKDASLYELAQLLSKAIPNNNSTRFSFRLIYNDNYKEKYQTKDIGHVLLFSRGLEANKTLDDVRFVIGDWIDVAINNDEGPKTRFLNRGFGRGRINTSAKVRSHPYPDLPPGRDWRKRETDENYGRGRSDPYKGRW
ncbi:hypothetical protein MERGE_002520 [Pneumocystis wakefieldiae]|uniref:40S ribosomal protein S25 n=1 Tax=Pneumocystis wakefieldiae TaxID=38082 RepID=A0A899FX57_9ASCO|nr:hypothetical protein MERGE_002520 [Pneumocystis wakefieldiae]